MKIYIAKARWTLREHMERSKEKQFRILKYLNVMVQEIYGIIIKEKELQDILKERNILYGYCFHT